MTAQTEKFGNGVSTKIENGKLMIIVDLEADFGLSSTGKNVMIASSGGNHAIAFNNQLVKVGLNVFRSPTPAELKANLG